VELVPVDSSQKTEPAEQWVANRCKFKPSGDRSRRIIDGTGSAGARFVEVIARSATALVGTPDPELSVTQDGFVIRAQRRVLSVRRTTNGSVAVNDTEFRDNDVEVLFSTLHEMLADTTARGFQFVQLNGGTALTHRLVPQGGVELVFDSRPEAAPKAARLLFIVITFSRDYRGAPPPVVDYELDARAGSASEGPPCP
jgi:hypothetical protein